jgi:hypothetical protein
MSPIRQINGRIPAERRKRIAADVISALTRAGVAAKVVLPEGDDTPTKGQKA